jgi:hypothetical protein
MAWTVPTLQIAGTTATAGWANTDIYGNTLELRATPGNRCSAYHNNTQTVNAGNTDALNLAAEDYDTATMHDTSTDNNKVVIPTGGGGFYIAIGVSTVDSANNGSCSLHLRVNGTSVDEDTAETSASNFEVRRLKVFAAQSMSAADYFDLAGSAVSNNYTFGSATSRLATRLRVVGPWPPS